MGGLRNPSIGKETLRLIENPRLMEENQQLKEELRLLQAQLESARVAAKVAEDSRAVALQLRDEVTRNSVTFSSHQQLVDRHNEVLREYGKLRADVAKGSPHLQNMKAAEVREKVVIKEVVNEVIRIRPVLHRAQALLIAGVALLVGVLAGALIF